LSAHSVPVGPDAARDSGSQPVLRNAASTYACACGLGMRTSQCRLAADRSDLPWRSLRAERMAQTSLVAGTRPLASTASYRST
jgi:hypothetical protein